MGRVANSTVTVGTLDAGEPTANLQVDAQGRLWVRPSLVAGAEAIASTAYGVDTQTAAVAVPDGASKLNLFIDLTAISGTGATLDLSVQWSSDGGTTWFSVETAQTFTQFTLAGGATAVCKQFDVLAPHYRLDVNIEGTTPSATFAVDHVGVYA